MSTPKKEQPDFVKRAMQEQKNYDSNNQFTFDTEIELDMIHAIAIEIDEDSSAEFFKKNFYGYTKVNNSDNVIILSLDNNKNFTYKLACVEDYDKITRLTALSQVEDFKKDNYAEIIEMYPKLQSVYEKLTKKEFDKYTTKKAKQLLPAEKNTYNTSVVSLGSQVRYEHNFEVKKKYNIEGFDVASEDSYCEQKDTSYQAVFEYDSNLSEEENKKNYLNMIASNSTQKQVIKNIYSAEERARARASMSKKRQQELIDNVTLNADYVNNPRYDIKFVTLTFDDHVTNPSIGWAEVSKFNKRLKRYLKKYYKLHKNFRYIAVIEPTEEGRVHIHSVFFDLGFIKKSVLQCLWRNIDIAINEDINLMDVYEYWVNIKKEDKKPFSHYKELFEKIELLKDKASAFNWFDNETICDLYQYFPSPNKVQNGLVDIRAVYDEAQKENMSIAQYVGKTIASYVGKTIALSYENEHEKNDWFGKRLISYSQNCKRVETSRIMHDQKSFKNQEHYEKFLDELSKLGTSKLKQSLDINKMIEDGYCVAAIKHNQQLAREQKKYNMINYYDDLIEQYTYHKLIVDISKRDYKTLCKKYGVIGFSYQSLEKNVKAKKRKQLEIAKRTLNTFDESKDNYSKRQLFKTTKQNHVKSHSNNFVNLIGEIKPMSRDEFFSEIQ